MILFVSPLYSTYGNEGHPAMGNHISKHYGNLKI